MTHRIKRPLLLPLLIITIVLQLVLALSAQTWSVAPPAQGWCRRVMRVRSTA